MCKYIKLYYHYDRTFTVTVPEAVFTFVCSDTHSQSDVACTVVYTFRILHAIIMTAFEHLKANIVKS